MHTAFVILLIIHVLAAVAGFGPMFQTGIIRRAARNVIELQHSLNILKRTGKAPRHSLIVVAISGVVLAGVAHLPGNQGWLLTSIVLLFVLVALLFGVFPGYYDKINKVISASVQAGNTTEIPAEYAPINKSLRMWERISLVIVAVIFLLMITQPF
ncbi:MAG: DUF2269 family protein [Tumebacillaceae bacterium]